MGNAKFFWYSDESGNLNTLDLGEGLSALEEEPAREQYVARSITGRTNTTHLWSAGRYRIERERTDDSGVALALQAFRNHLQRGGRFSFAEDADKAVAGFIDGRLPTRGSNTFGLIFPTPWPYNGSADLASGDWVRLMGPSPVRLQELCQMSSTFTPASAALVTLANVKFDYSSERWVLFSHRGFYPCLRLPPEQRDQPIFTTDHRNNWTIDFVAEEDNWLLEQFAAAPDSPVSTSTPDYNNLESPPLILGTQQAQSLGPRVWTAPR